jgi:hypothetical protein
MPNFERLTDVDYLDDGSLVACGVISDAGSDGILMKISPFGEVQWELRIDQSNFGFGDNFESLVVVDNDIFVQGNFFNTTSGKAEIRVTKIDQDGEVDRLFGDFGSTRVEYTSAMQGWEIVADNDGNLFIPGVIYELDQAVIVKLLPDGKIDTTFGDSGFSIQPYQNFSSSFVNAVPMGNEIYAVGWYRGKEPEDAFDANGMILKLSNTGEKNAQFGNNGFLTFDGEDPTYLEDIAVFGPDHLIFLTSLQGINDGTFIHKIDLDGNKDLTFGDDGTIELDFGFFEYMDQLSLDPEQGIYISGRAKATQDLTIGKFNSDGSPDKGFGDDGFTSFDLAGELQIFEAILSPDGSLVIAGHAYDKFDSDYLIAKIEATPTCTAIIEEVNLEGCDQVEFDGNTYSESGEFSLTYTANNGCDSIVMLQVSVNLSSQSTISLESCDEVTFNDETFSTTGTYSQTLTNVAGCDSVVTIDILLNEASTETILSESCETVTVNNETYSTTGTYTQNLTNASGCDSILTIEVQINALEAIVELDEQTLTSQNETGLIEWFDCDEGVSIEGENGLTFNPSKSGSYALILSSEICSDTSDCLTLEITSGIKEVPLESNLRVFPNPVYDFVLIEKPEDTHLSSIRVFDASGKSYKIQHSENNNLIKIDLNEIPPSLYYIQLLFREKSPSLVKIIKNGS